MRDEKKVESGNDKFPQILFTFLESAKDSAYNGHKDFPKVGHIQIPKPHLAKDHAPRGDPGLSRNLFASR